MALRDLRVRQSAQMMPPLMPRKPRRPQHPFYIKQRPFSITPFFIAPVLPRETLKLLMWQARCVTKPIANPIVGHWLEYYYFYVKHRDLDARESLTQMMLDPAAGTGITPAAATSVPLYTAQGTVPWVSLCLKRITEEYFRVPGEDWNVEVDASGLPVAQIISDNWLDSVQWESEMPEGPNVDLDLNADDTITAREAHVALQQYELLRAMGLTQTTYEEYLATYGIRQPERELHRPELVRYTREWRYPVNHVATEGEDAGTPTSAVSWAITERADKDRFFAEPGFLFGVSIWRPKVYLGGQAGTASGLLGDMLAWLPRVMAGDGSMSLRKIETSNALLPNVDPDATPGPLDPYWVDLRDLFIHGEQWVSNADAPKAALPDADLRRRYMPQADISDLFAGADEYAEQDGIVSMTILGEQVDQTLATPRPTRAT